MSITDGAEIEDALANEVRDRHAQIPLAEVLQKTKQAEDADVAYLMACQLNVMYEANTRLRGRAGLTASDTQACFRMMDYMIRERTVGANGRRQ
jgi:hypothetical protein